MKKCEQALAKDPRNAEALVWHGSGLSFQAKQVCMAGEVEKGRQIQAQAAKEMNDAVAMRFDDVSVLIPRGSIFLSAALHVPSPKVARKDFQIAADCVCKLPSPRNCRFIRAANCWVYSQKRGTGWETPKSREVFATHPWKSFRYLLLASGNGLLSTPPKPGPLGTTCLGCHVSATPDGRAELSLGLTRSWPAFALP